MAPCHVLLGLQARRRKPRIIRYNHEHQGPAHDGRAQRRCRRNMSTHTLAFMMTSLLILLMFVTLPGRPDR